MANSNVLEKSPSPASRVDTNDRALVAAAGSGSPDAIEELWNRHSPAGVSFARSFTYVADPYELVSEAFVRILATLRRGSRASGTSFRAYLLATIRNIAATWARQEVKRKEDPVGSFELFTGAISAEETVIIRSDRALALRALCALPPRWQEVLWHIEVDRISRNEVARALGMTPNGVSQLAFRARNALRTAWVQAQVDRERLSDGCRPTSSDLGAYVRHDLTHRRVEVLDAHLATCSACAALVRRLSDTASLLP